MHRDTKIGLAMSILLIGIASALCLPDNRDPLPDVPPLAQAEALNLAIRDRSIRTYAEPGPVDSLLLEALRRSEESVTAPPVPAFEPVDLFAGPRDAPPIQTTRAAAIPAPLQAAAPERPVPVATARLTEEHLPRAAPEPVYHTVRSGDTLSGIAKKYLGSVARFPEIYEANRDVLKSPDDLRLGMKLRIPSAEVTIESPNRSAAEPASTPSGADERELGQTPLTQRDEEPSEGSPGQAPESGEPRAAGRFRPVGRRQ